MRLTRVVLPAPFGPMRPRISPGWIARSTPPVATSPPKRLVSPCGCSSAAPAPASRLADAFAEEAGRPHQQDKDNEQEAVDVLIRCADERGAKGFDETQQHARDQRAGDRPESADDNDLEAFHRGD